MNYYKAYRGQKPRIHEVVFFQHKVDAPRAFSELINRVRESAPEGVSLAVQYSVYSPFQGQPANIRAVGDGGL